MWGGVSINKLRPLFVTQKKCIRILFGDYDAYIKKFKICDSEHSFCEQISGSELFRKESTKPLFAEQNILTVHNLYKYYCLIETFKILKLRNPYSLYLLFNRSKRKETFLITPTPSTNFAYMSAHLWNNCRQALAITEFTNLTISSFKSTIKKFLHSVQNKYDATEWINLNFEAFSV